MHVLALDTTTRDGSVAIVDEIRVLDERRGDASRGHAERLPYELTVLAADQGLPLSTVDLFAVASGPGSFTGLRIGIATVQGLAKATGRRVVAVSALEALAQSVGDAAPGTLVGVWMDAHRHEVFAALYRVTEAAAFAPEHLVETDGPSVGEPAAVLERWHGLLREAPVAFVGDGAVLYDAVIVGREGAAWRVVTPTPLLAGAIGRMAVARALRGGSVDPAAVQPLYVRRPDAEVDRDKRALTER
jgi:tRNA threonylcarbamoyladenosine biosynthesis protein TsaB